MDITNTLKAIVILDSEGKETLSKYFDEQIITKQFEKKLFIKTKSHRIKDEILIIDNLLVVHRFVVNLHLYVIGNRGENPLILDSVATCLVEVMSTLLNTKSVEPKSVYDNLTQVILALDEMCEDGLIIETDPNLVLQRVCLKDEVMEQSMAQKIQSATEHIKFPWIRS